MFAKRFFFICAGLLCLAAAYHLGATSAGAQKVATPTPIAGWEANSRVNGDFNGSLVVMSNGDVYWSDASLNFGKGSLGSRWQRVGNVFTP